MGEVEVGAGHLFFLEYLGKRGEGSSHREIPIQDISSGTGDGVSWKSCVMLPRERYTTLPSWLGYAVFVKGKVDFPQVA